MLYAMIAVIAALLLFMLISFLLTSKNYSFNIDNNEIRVQNRGAHLKIFVNGQLFEDYYMPQLIKGEEYKIVLNNDKEVVLKCKSSALGYKMRVELIVEGNTVADNGVKLKKEKAPEKQEKSIDETLAELHNEASEKSSNPEISFPDTPAQTDNDLSQTNTQAQDKSNKD